MNFSNRHGERGEAIQAPSFRDSPKDPTTGAQLRTGESRDSGFDASHRPGMTFIKTGLLRRFALRNDGVITQIP
jgi:hypothetical protein